MANPENDFVPDDGFPARWSLGMPAMYLAHAFQPELERGIRGGAGDRYASCSAVRSVPPLPAPIMAAEEPSFRANLHTIHRLYTPVHRMAETR